ncbi:MAG TPA: hypothetical protein PKB14_00255 [Rubrivivax sp.]|nr:hypothetical protein [Rubrivivax sp.]
MNANPEYCCRIGFVIRDIRTAVPHWLQLHRGAGPWTFMHELTEENYLRGQTTFFVDDLSSAMKHLSERQGIGPWFYACGLTPDAASYRGAPASISYSKAYANSRDSQEMVIELVQVSAASKSIFSELFNEAVHAPLLGVPENLPPGTRNVSATSCWYATSTSTIAAKKQKLKESGYAVVHEVTRKHPDETVVYTEHPEVPGLMLEVAETTFGKRALLETITTAGRNWDRKDPMRLIAGASTIS